VASASADRKRVRELRANGHPVEMPPRTRAERKAAPKVERKIKSKAAPKAEQPQVNANGRDFVAEQEALVHLAGGDFSEPRSTSALFMSPMRSL
jgi:hypothetical protein